MALNIDPASIAEALRRNVESWTPTVERGEVGRVTETADGVARVQGLPGAMANELLEFPGGVFGLAFNLDVDEIGCIILGESDKIEEGDPVKQTGTILSMPVGDGFLGRVVDALGRPLDDKGPIPSTERRNLEVQAPNVVSRQPVKEPLYTGISAIDAMTAIGRGQRQLIIGDRQTGKTAVAVDAIIAQREHWGTDQRGEVHLRGHRPESVHGVGGGRDAPGERGARVHGRRERVGRGSRAVPVHRALCGRGARRVLDVRGRQRVDRLRRPVQAGRRLPRDLTAAPPAAGTRGVSGRRVLPALASARARGEALRRSRRRFPHGAADHRDEGRRHLRVHPDQRHLDHRRADLLRIRAVLLRRAAGDQRRRLGVSRWRQRADQGDEEGRRAAPSRPRAVPRVGGVRAVRLGARQGVAATARARRSGRRDPEAAAVPAAARRTPGRGDLRGHRRVPRRLPRRGCQAVRDHVQRLPRDTAPRDPDRDPGDRRPVRRERGRAEDGDRRVRGRRSRRAPPWRGPSRGSAPPRPPTRSSPTSAGTGCPSRRRRAARPIPRRRRPRSPWALSSASSVDGSDRSNRRRRSRAPWS